MNTHTYELERARVTLREARRVLGDVKREVKAAERANLRTRPRDVQRHVPPTIPGALAVKFEEAERAVEREEKTVAFVEHQQRGSQGSSTIFATFGGPGRIMAVQNWGPGPYADRAYPGQQRRPTWDDDGEVPSRPSWWPR